MLAWSVRRRFFYLAIIALLIIAGGVFLLWKFNPEPSCFDGRLNQNETGVDCGGSCEQVCLVEIKDLRVFWVRALPIAAGQYDVAALISNPNRQYGAKNFAYLIKLIDERGILITTKQGRASLNPEEKFVIYNSRLNVGRRQPARATLEIIELPTWQRVTQTAPALTIRQHSFSNLPFPTLIAEVGNQTLTEWRDLEVVALLSDAAGNAFAVSSTEVELLPKKGSSEIAFTWPQPFEIEQPTINFYTHLDLMTN